MGQNQRKYQRVKVDSNHQIQTKSPAKGRIHITTKQTYKCNEKSIASSTLAKRCLHVVCSKDNLVIELDRHLTNLINDSTTTEQIVKHEGVKVESNHQLQGKDSILIPSCSKIVTKCEKDECPINQVSNNICFNETSDIKKSERKYYKNSKSSHCGRISKNTIRRRDNYLDQALRTHKEKYKRTIYEQHSKKCPYCNFVGSNSYKTHTHIMATHDQINPFICTFCDYSTSYSQNFRIHQCNVNRSRYSNIGRKCLHCNFISATSYKTHTHMMITHDQIKSFKCKFCDYCSLNLSTLKCHNATMHQNEILQSCPFCDLKSFASDYNRHIMTVHDCIRPFQCKLCEYSAHFSRQLKIHMATLHKNDHMEISTPILQSCRYCNFKGSTSAKNSHVKKVHDQLRMFKCTLCNYSTAYPCNLKTHNGSTHLQLKDQICPHCNIKRHSANICKHIMAIHDLIRPFRCKFCEHAAAYSYRLKTHNASVHKDEYLEVQSQTFHSCSFCKYRTTSITKKKRHVQEFHDRIRPFQCKFCEFAASNSSNLKRHLKVHINKTLC